MLDTIAHGQVNLELKTPETPTLTGTGADFALALGKSARSPMIARAPRSLLFY